MALNIVGIKEAASLNVFLAVVDFATQLLLVLLGFFLVFSPEILVDNVHFGVAPTWGNFLLAIPVGMIAYTGIETVSNLAEEARDPARNVPRAYLLTAIAVFAIFFTLPAIALSALPVTEVGGEFQTLLGLPPEEGGYAADPVLGVVDNLGVSGLLLDVLQIYVGVLAATILFIATNAGVIGVSRITYAMSGYRQLPEVFRRLHPRFKTPWVALVVFAGFVSIADPPAGRARLPRDDVLVRRDALVHDRPPGGDRLAVSQARRGAPLPRAAEPPHRRGRLAAVRDHRRAATGLAWVVVVWQTPETRVAGLGWLAMGLVGYFVYRRWFVHASVTETVRAPAIVLVAPLEISFRTIVVPVLPGPESEEAMVAAARLAADKRSRIALVTVIEVPLELPLDADLRGGRGGGRARARRRPGPRRRLRRPDRDPGRPSPCRGAGDRRGRLGRDAELIVVGAPRTRMRRGKPIFGRTVDYVLKRSPIRVLVAASRQAA